MNNAWTAVVAALPGLIIALTAWLRAETANKALKSKQDKPNA